MKVFLNGKIVGEDQAVVSVFDRSFLYGDGLFETIRVCRSLPFLWAQHMSRLQAGAGYLGIRLPFDVEALHRHALELITMNQLPEALLRITVSRGVGTRGYSIQGANSPACVMSVHPLPVAPLSWRLITAAIRVTAGEPLAVFKTNNKLVQILARREAEAAGADEALLLNTQGEVTEAAGSNLFWIEDGTVCTPPLESGILTGVTREFVLELCGSLGLPTQETAATPERILQSDGVFLSLSSYGLVSVSELDGRRVGASPLTGRLYQAYQTALRSDSK